MFWKSRVLTTFRLQREEVNNDAVAEDQENTGTTKPRSRNELSLESMLWALPQHVKASRGVTIQQSHQRSESIGDVLEASDLPPQFFQDRPDLKQSVMEAIQESKSRGCEGNCCIHSLSHPNFYL